MDNHCSQNIFVRTISQHSQLVISRETVSSIQLSMSLELMANARKLFAQCPINRPSLLPQYVPTALLGSLQHTSSSQQLHGNHECSMQAVRSLSVHSFGSRPLNLGTYNCQKIFVDILDHENIFTRKFKTRKFPDLRYIKFWCCSYYFSYFLYILQSVPEKTFSGPKISIF